MSSAILLYAPAIVRKLAGIFRAGYKEKQTGDSHFQPKLSFKSVSNFLFTFLIVSYSLSLLQQQSLGFPKEDKAEEEVWDVAVTVWRAQGSPSTEGFCAQCCTWMWKESTGGATPGRGQRNGGREMRGSSEP